MQVRDLMSTDVIAVDPETSLKEAARRMLVGGVSGLPVTDSDGSLVGIITEADFVSNEAERRREERAGLLRFFVDRGHDIPSEERRVGDVMTTDVVVIDPDADHADAARLMEKEGVKRLPVVEDGTMVGLISRKNLLRAFTRSDQAIIEEIRDYVLARVMWIYPDKVKVESIDGNVKLSGRLDNRTDTEMLVELTKRLDGVVSVDSELTWDIDNTKLDRTSPLAGMPPRPN